MATPHFIHEEKTAENLRLSSLNKRELAGLSKTLFKKLKELEDLVHVISKGKYMWEATFDAITEPVMIVKEDYTVDRANLALAKVAQKEITKVPGQKCFEIFANRSSPCLHCPLPPAIQNREQTHAPLGNKIHSKDFLAYAYPFYNEKGHLESTVMYYRDMTEELRLKQEVIQQEKMAAIGMLAGGVAHEVNNPLGGVLAFTQLLLQKTDKDSETHRDLMEIEQAARRCKKIVQDLLDFSRVSKEKEKCLVQVNVLIQKVLPFIQMEIRSLNIEWITELTSDLPEILAVPNRLQQVFLNLLTNACHAMPKGGKLTLKTGFDKKAKEIWVKVKDTGHGMSEEIQTRIFEPFFTTKEPGKGTGLGLSISYRIVKELGGRFEIESEEGKGSTLTVLLPAVSP